MSVGNRLRRWLTAGGAAAGLAIGGFAAAPATAAPCETGDFAQWLQTFKAEAMSLGVSPATAANLDGLTYDKKVIGLDRNQKHFKVPFEQFLKQRLNPGRVAKGAQMMKKHAALLKRIEERFGVPGEVLVAIWGLETDYGAVSGKMPVLRSLATLAYDCRRTDLFQTQLIDALRVIDRGDLTAAEMRGAWAGELGQTQFMASSYYQYAIDFDGDGHADLLNSVPDVLASTANYLKGYGWQRGAGWEEGEPNYQALKGWNKSDNYTRTIGVFAKKLAGGA